MSGPSDTIEVATQVVVSSVDCERHRAVASDGGQVCSSSSSRPLVPAAKGTAMKRRRTRSDAREDLRLAKESSRREYMGLEPGLEEAHAAARREAHQSTEGPQAEGAPVKLRSILSAAEISRCHEIACASGRRSEPAAAWRRPVQVCAALADCWFDVIYSAEHVSLFLHRDGLFARRCPELLHKLIGTMRTSGCVDPSTALQVRCIELHSYAVGGALSAPLHRDSGSTVTISIQLSDAACFEGGRFVTWSNEGEPEYHSLEQGDAVLFNSMDLHNVTMVTRGVRHSLVCELWTEPANNHDRFT